MYLSYHLSGHAGELAWFVILIVVASVGFVFVKFYAITHMFQQSEFLLFRLTKGGFYSEPLDPMMMNVYIYARGYDPGDERGLKLLNELQQNTSTNATRMKKKKPRNPADDATATASTNKANGDNL
jgi:hypothetical protein